MRLPLIVSLRRCDCAAGYRYHRSRNWHAWCNIQSGLARLYLREENNALKNTVEDVEGMTPSYQHEVRNERSRPALTARWTCRCRDNGSHPQAKVDYITFDGAGGGATRVQGP